MYGLAPYSDNAYSALRVAVPDPHYLWCGESWATHGVMFQSTPADERWSTQGLAFERLPAAELWSTHGIVFAELGSDERWITQAAGGELVCDERWATEVPEIQQLPADERWSVAGVGAQDLPAGERWETEGFPINLLFCDERWSTDAPVLEDLPADEQWPTAGIELEQLLADERWATAVPSISLLECDERWFFNFVVARSLSVRWGSSVRRGLRVRYQTGKTKVRNDVRVAWSLMTRVAQQCRVRYAIEGIDRPRAALRARWSILDGAVIVDTGQAVLEVRGRSIVLNDWEINTDKGQYAWTCSVTLPNPNDLALFGPDEPFTITIAGEEFSFIRQEPQLARTAPAQTQASVRGISPSAVYGEPRAEKVTKTWSDAIPVSALLEELFGAGVVELRVLDWSIGRNRLAVNGQTPIEIAATVAKATGGLIESEPDGSLYIRAAWPISVQFLEDLEPDHLFDDLRDAFSIEEQVTLARIVNRIRILDEVDTASGLLAAEVDSREDGYNQGRTQFVPGDQPALLIFKSDDVEIEDVTPSAGNIAPLAGGTMEVEETLQFANSDTATLRYPTTALTSSKWLGRDLGTPELVDAMTVKVPAAGVAMLLVTYDAAFEARRLSGVPAQLAGEDNYDVLVVVDGVQA